MCFRLITRVYVIKAFSPPARANTEGKRPVDFIALLPDHHPLKNYQVILAPQLKQKDC
jgi:hypothetical protein